jgi:hypothetical protein
VAVWEAQQELLVMAGAEAFGAFGGLRCRHEATASGRLGLCPCCGGGVWRWAAWKPFSRRARG